MRKAIFLAIAGVLISAGVVLADYVQTTLTVPAWYQCEIKKFDLHCTTNAQSIYINGKKYER